MFCFKDKKMNEIVNTFLLAERKLMPERRLRQPGFTYGALGPFAENIKRIKKKLKPWGFKIYLSKCDLWRF